MRRISRFGYLLKLGVAGIALVPSLAFAQSTDANEEAEDSREIVVTGTLLRGAPPVGTNVITVGDERIAETGATTANELLATVPQVTNLFNNVPTARLGIAANQIQVVRPNLRGLAGETSSSASTLVLFDGHRIAPVGVTQNAVDPDLIPSIAIERVEVVTDGGSATYGSDAVGGVINFITRRRFDGLKVQARYGFADDYSQVDAGIIAGKDWGSGSLFAAYGYQHNDALFGRDRDFVRDVDWLSTSLTPRGRACSPGNVQIGSNLFALPALTSTTPNACDPTDDSTTVPRSTRHGAVVGLHQDFTDWLTVDVRGFYGERTATSLGPIRGSINLSAVSSPEVDLRPFGIPFVIPASFRNFYYTPVPGQSPVAGQTVFFSLAPVLGRNSARSITEFQEWGTNAEFQAKLSDDWQLRVLFNYSKSNSEFHIEGMNQALLNQFANGETAATTINFYNPGAGSSDAANIARLVDAEGAGQGKERLFDARAILDGSLFTLPGGDVKLAVGYEHMFDGFRQRVSPANGTIGAIYGEAFTEYTRKIDSVFGEIQVPLVGPDNRSSLIHTLTLAGSVRYDHFSDFGSTTNPKFGITYKPVEWLGLRGNYSTSFNAPSPNDQLGALRNSAGYFGFNAFVRSGDAPTANGTIALQGSNPGLVPQEAETYSFGIDLDPAAGLHASVNYYNVKFDNIIGQPFPGPQIFALFPNNVIANAGGVPLAQVVSFLNASGAPQAQAVLTSVSAACTNTAACPNVYELVDFRQGNYGTLNIEGLDFNVQYRATTGFGGIDAGISGNYELSRKSQTGVGSPVVDELITTNRVVGGNTLVFNARSRLNLSASIGADIGNFRAQATLNHSSGYRVVRCDATTTPACAVSTTGIPTASGLPQDRVGAFDTVNLFFKYAVPSESTLLKDLELTLNINNVFDTDPPIYRSIGGSGYANGFTLGRMVQIGISKKF